MVMNKRSGEAKVAAAAQTQTRPSSSNRPLPPPPPLQPRAPPQPPLLAHPRFEPVDREKIPSSTCPLLLRVLTKIGSHHNEEDFAVRGKEPKDEVQIYTWKDATLREITDLVKEVAPEARRRNAKLSFAFVYPDQRGCFVLRTVLGLKYDRPSDTLLVGMTLSYGNRRRVEDSMSLGELSFQIGDYLDVAIL